jgi:Mg-chelatase subunit ChlD
MYDQIPDLWQTTEQPITAVKNAISLFLNDVEQQGQDDRVGLCVYTSGNGTAELELELTYDFDQIDTTSRHRQAAHYALEANIGDGIRRAREHLEADAREGASKVIVLITDGDANLPAPQPADYALNQAQLAANSGIEILTISLGADADRDLMAEIAGLTSGIHFDVPGGQTVAEYQWDLMDVYARIARHRSGAKLVK